MICESYQQLTPFEKQQFVHKLHHIIMSDEDAFQAANLWLKWAEKKGLLNGVEILPERERSVLSETLASVMGTETYKDKY